MAQDTKRGKGGSAPAGPAPAVVKRYADRRLFNTASASYVTLDDLEKMAKRGEPFLVFDSQSGEDITQPMLLLLQPEPGQTRH